MASEMTPTTADIEQAADRLRGQVARTVLHSAPEMGQRAGSRVAIKAEHQQTTGSFKFRGACNRLGILEANERSAGVITASSGNHGIAIATAGRALGVASTVVVPTGASEAKLARIRAAGAELVVVDSTDGVEAERHAALLATDNELTYVSPYDDAAVVAGQGTIGLEILEQAADLGWDDVDAIVASVGGGGLISGIATAVGSGVKIIGAQPENDAAMSASVSAGQVVAIGAKPTLSDGTAGGIVPDAITFAACRDLVDQWMLVTETEIARGIRHMIDHHAVLIEGAAAVAISAGMAWAHANPGSRVAIVSCGANISSATLQAALELAR